MAEELTVLPFDIYQRYRVIADLAETCFERFPGTEGDGVLDVGGYPGHLAAFLPQRQVTFCDLIEGEIAHSPYVRGSATALPFPDNAFPVVSCCDVLEHVPPAGRRRVLDELLRVASLAVVLAGPFDDPGVAEAEKIVSDYYQSLWHEEHPWLSEHLALGLPGAEEVTGWAAERGLPSCSLPNGYLHHWTLMMFANHLTLSLPGFPEMYQHFNNYYNLYFYPESNREPSYRRVIYIQKAPGDLPRDLPLALPPRDGGQEDIRDIHRLLQVFFRCLSDRAQGHHRYALEQAKKLEHALAGEEGPLVKELREKETRYEEALADHRRAITLARDEISAQQARIERLEEALSHREAEAGEFRRLAGEREALLQQVEASLSHRFTRALRRLLGREGG
jgi:SAM-dependent methyltransferase